MQTRFSPQALQDPDTAASNRALRSCVHCGFCTATCPTYVLLGDERDSPRGRIGLIKTMLESGAAPTRAVVRHLDKCLTCLSCMSTCPSGVNYLHLIDHARATIEERYRRPLPDRVLRLLLAQLLPRPALLRPALAAARVARPAARLLPARFEWSARLRTMLALAPRTALPAPGPGAGTYAAEGPRRARVALLAGCAQRVLAPGINAAAIRLLTRLGCEVVIAPGATCCGALEQHMGRATQARATMARTIQAWEALIAEGGLDAILVTTSGCGTTIKEYGHLWRATASASHDAARRVAALTRDITEWLAEIGYAPSRPPSNLRVAYHAACSLQHGQRVREAPRALLSQAGFTVLEPQDAHLCCGSAGTYNLLQPAIASQLRERKLTALAALNPDIIAAGNLGCLTQLAGAIPTIHTVELLDWAAGGPPPATLPPRRQRVSRAAAAAAAAVLAAAAPLAAPVAPILNQLASAPTEAAAARLEQQAIAAWHDAATDAVQVLEDDAVIATHTGHLADAIADLDAALELQPELADLWRRRGELRLATGDRHGAANDLAQALSREPKLFPALAALSRLEEARGRPRQAMDVWRHYLEISPRSPGGADRLEHLRILAEGQPL